MKKGSDSCPERILPSRTTTFLSVIMQFVKTFSPITVSWKRIEFLILAPLETLTPRKRIEFSTLPSIMQPSAMSEFLTLEVAEYLVGAEFLTFV